MEDQIIKFIRKKDFVLKAELGRGACGQTVLLYDAAIDENFVCKKYLPIYEHLRPQLFANFIREIKLLHLANHINIVRVFNYYLYPEQYLGYILMEHVEGNHIQDHLHFCPEDVNEVFVQVIDGFTYLEENNILHRDIRPQNILVTTSSKVKIIDFGFGKQAVDNSDFEKSITLNWWCTPPKEFKDSVYDHQTEIYFVGKLFEKIIEENSIEHFKHHSLLKKMCSLDRANRPDSFNEIRKEVLSDKFFDIDFSEGELEAYRDFSNSLFNCISKIESKSTYHTDPSYIQSCLEGLYKKVMLEECIPDNSSVSRCFISGNYYYSKRLYFHVNTLKNFVNLLRTAPTSKKNIIVSNLLSKLDAVARYDETAELKDDIPF